MLEPRPLLIIRSVVAALLFATSAHAADKPASFGKGKAAGPLLTRAELRECLAQAGRIRSLGEEAGQLQAVLNADQAEINRLNAARKDTLATLDRTNPEAVQAYNAEGAALDQRIDAYNARTPSFNAKVDALQAERDTFAKACDNRNYDEKDEIAIKNGK
jgi:uncharacterized protein involved in exopolysaccharide biosynthesis